MVSCSPSLRLLTLLLPFQSPCLETEIDGVSCGGCTSHADKCGAGKGVFLRIKKCDVAIICDVKKGD